MGKIDGFGIRKNGTPFYRVLGRTLKYPDVEEIPLPNGKTIQHEIMKEFTEPYRDETPEEKGWKKVVQFEDVILLDVADRKNRFKITKALFHRVYEIDVKEYYRHHKCALCEHNGLGSRYHYLRTMEAGVYTLCWLNASKFSRTASGPIQTLISREGDVAPWVRLVSEKKVTKKRARAILRRLQRMPNLAVSMYLGEQTGLEVL